jgi:hypothetical protein
MYARGSMIEIPVKTSSKLYMISLIEWKGVSVSTSDDTSGGSKYNPPYFKLQDEAITNSDTETSIQIAMSKTEHQLAQQRENRCSRLLTKGPATSSILSFPYSCSTKARANSTDVPGPWLVTAFLSTTTLELAGITSEGNFSMNEG